MRFHMRKLSVLSGCVLLGHVRANNFERTARRRDSGSATQFWLSSDALSKIIRRGWYSEMELISFLSVATKSSAPDSWSTNWRPD